jgi:hypothetical protein
MAEGRDTPKSDAVGANIGEVIVSLLEVCLEKCRADWKIDTEIDGDSGIREEKIQQYKEAFRDDVAHITRSIPSGFGSVRAIMYLAALNDALNSMLEPVDSMMSLLGMPVIRRKKDKQREDPTLELLRVLKEKVGANLPDGIDVKNVHVVKMNSSPNKDGSASMGEYMEELLKSRN